MRGLAWSSNGLVVCLIFLSFCANALGSPIAHLGPAVAGERTNIIVSLDPQLPQMWHELHLQFVSDHLEVLRNYSLGSHYLGYMASVRSTAVDLVTDLLENMPEVLLVEPDAVGHLDEVETNAPWGLGRISHRHIESDQQFQQYIHKEEGGQGVKVYLLDTGVYAGHDEFQVEQEGFFPPLPRVRLIKNFVHSEWSEEDVAGHGTHCAGTIGGAKYGVAKSVSIDVIKVCDGLGMCQMSDVIAGLDYAVTQFLSSPNGAGTKGALISMSLGLPANQSRSLALAARAAVRNGILVVASAGNDATDACSHTPASVPEVLTVGATNIRDERVSFSNFGSCVDIFAPGDNILSASNLGPHRTRTMSGTSMATPHVAGVVAYYLSLAEDGVFTTPEYIKGFIMSRATPTLVSDARESRNLLVFNG